MAGPAPSDPPAPRRRRLAAPRTWAIARELYHSGATAREVEETLGIGVAALRQRAWREGWTKTAQAEVEADARGTPPRAVAAPPVSEGSVSRVDPVALAHHVAARAAEALMRGRGAEAERLARAGGQVQKLLADLPAAPQTAEEREAHLRAHARRFAEDVWEAGKQLAQALLADGCCPALYTRAAFAWRAEHLGAEAAAEDRRHAEDGGWVSEAYDAEGFIRPPETYDEFVGRWGWAGGKGKG